VLLPAGCRAAYPDIEEAPAAMREVILNLRDTEAGQFALNLFARERSAAPVS
jgi:glutathione S-transferase